MEAETHPRYRRFSTEFTGMQPFMIVYTDYKQYAEDTLTARSLWREVDSSAMETKLRHLSQRIFGGRSLHRTKVDMESCWQYAFLVNEASSSQYDLLIEMSRQNIDLPNGIICLAGAGKNFHGQRGRLWSAQPGNIHLAACLTPNTPIERFHIGFSLLAAVSVLDSIDSLAPLAGRAGIKWVNDILLEGAKVAGFLAHTSSSGDIVTSAVLGIGLNVETTPRISGDEVTPRAASLRDYLPDPSICRQRAVLCHLLQNLNKNYELLLSGHYFRLLDRYRKRSIIIGRRVRIVSDAPSGPEREIAAGRVREIGDNLELFLDGVTEPVTRGRLILAD
jgi:BirA family biotin operon repressor/biotin-[acetyl-CoA-carboxylase] ligase